MSKLRNGIILPALGAFIAARGEHIWPRLQQPQLGAGMSDGMKAASAAMSAEARRIGAEVAARREAERHQQTRKVS